MHVRQNAFRGAAGYISGGRMFPACFDWRGDMSSSVRTIDKLSVAAGVKVPTIRSYEQIGLLPKAPRTASDRRLYDDPAFRRLWFIRHARQLGVCAGGDQAVANAAFQRLPLGATRTKAGSRSPPVPRQFRALFVSLCAALLVVVSLYGALQTNHRIAHASDWPPVASVGSEVDADHDPLHVHVAPDASEKGDAVPSDDDDRDNGLRSSGHHHPSSGDSPNLVPAIGPVVKAVHRSNGVQHWSARDRSHPEHDGDGPEYPPKRMRTVV